MNRRRLGAWLVGVPALLDFALGATATVVGFPVSLLLLPILGPLMLLFGAQARAAQRLLRGAPEAVGTVVMLAFVAAVIAMAGAVLASGVIRSSPPAQNEGSLWPYQLGLIGATAPGVLGGILVFDRKISPTRGATVLAAAVLAAGLVVLMFWPTAG